MLVNAVKRAVIGNELKRGFFTDSGDARNVVRRVAHKRLYVNELLGLNTVLFVKRRAVKYFGLSR